MRVSWSSATFVRDISRSDKYLASYARSVAEQRPRDKQMYNSRYCVTASQTNMFPLQQLNYNNEERCFLCGPCRDVLSRTVWAPDGCFAPRQTGRLTVGRNITFDFYLRHWVVLSESVCKQFLNCCCSVLVSCCREELVAEAGDSPGTHSKGMVRRLKPLPSNG
jgi:hypothetical protein